MERVYCTIALLILLVLTNSSNAKKGKRRRKLVVPDDSEWFDDVHQSSIDLINALGPEEYGLPASCSSEVLVSIFHRCVLIWQEYCNCQHCASNCSEDKWPPPETAKWKTGKEQVGWEEIDVAWKWAGKCAFNATHWWRIWCTEEAQYKYWFLTKMSADTDKKNVEDLCHQTECADKAKIHGTPTTSESSVTSGTSKTSPSTTVQIPTLSDTNTPNAIIQETTTNNRRSTDQSVQLTNDDILNALGPNNDGLSVSCSESDLDRILHRCIVIWREFCRCAWCQTTCQESDWPPSEAEEWKTGEGKIGWEHMKTSWSWAGRCAYNSTYLWRKWCSDESEHDYWYLTDLRADMQYGMVLRLCDNECTKLKAEEATHYTSESPTLVKTTALGDNRTESSFEMADRTEHAESGEVLVVPRWAYTIIIALGTILISIGIALVVYFCLKKRKRKEGAPVQMSLRGQNLSRKESSTTDNCNSWPVENNYAFFGQQHLPGLDDSIYHTIGDAPLPLSPTFNLGSFGPRSELTRSSQQKSVRNVLYHDTVPGGEREEMTTSKSGDENPTHTYEDAYPSAPNESDDNATNIPTPPPYFVPVTLGNNEGGQQYGSLSQDTPRFEVSEQSSDNAEGKDWNYDHIRLI